MARKRSNWTYTEEKKLIEYYHTKTIRELAVMFPNRTDESINNKIKRMKAQGKIKDGKTDNAIKRAYSQRRTEVFFTVDQTK